MVIRPAGQDDHAAIRAVNLEAFPTAQEADLVDALRASGDGLAELVAVLDGAVIGHILFTRLGLAGEHDTLPGAALAPVAVFPEHQNCGVGGRLIIDGVETCRSLGVAAIVVLGHPAYYPRHGFTAQTAAHLKDPFDAGDAFMAMELEKGSLREPRRPIYAEPFRIPN